MSIILLNVSKSILQFRSQIIVIAVTLFNIHRAQHWDVHAFDDNVL